MTMGGGFETVARNKEDFVHLIFPNSIVVNNFLDDEVFCVFSIAKNTTASIGYLRRVSKESYFIGF